MDMNDLPTDLRDRLCYLVVKRDWDTFINNLQPKKFPKDESGNIVDRNVVAKLAEILTRPELDLPCRVKSIIIRCLTNACISHDDAGNVCSYMHKAIDMVELNPQFESNYCNMIYAALSLHNINELNDVSLTERLMEYPSMNFPYDGVVQWIIDQLNLIHDSDDISADQWDIMRLFFSFLCNIAAIIDQDLPESIHNPKLQKIIIKLFAMEFDTPQKITLLRGICCFIHNIMNIVDEYFMPDDLVDVTHGLLKADQLEINIAQDILLLLMNTPGFVHDTYDILPTELKLYSLEVFYQNLKNTVYHPADDSDIFIPSDDAIEFFASRFKQKSDSILKTVDTYVNNMEPVEVTILLDILGVLTSTKHTDSVILRNDLSLLINTVYLLKALHMTGKTMDNCFTPVQKLSEIVPNTQDTSKNATTDKNIQDHPAFGFKAALIRLIGNLVFKNKQNQDMVRDIDGIPLLLDCCNIDARNPLIVQWTILAIRNLCEGNKEIQDIIHNSQKLKYVDSEIVREFGVKLNENEDGNVIGIVPLPKNS